MELIPPTDTDKLPLLARTFHSLRYRDFRLFWIALTVSLLGLSFQTLAQGWLVYRLTSSATMLGVAGFVPAILAAPASIAGGLIADRVSRRKLIILTQALMMLPPVALSYLIWSERVQVWHVVAATTILAVIAAIDLPSRTAIVPQLVHPDDLLNAQGLASAVRQVTRIVGPALAGVVVMLWGEAIPYLVNGLSYLAMVMALLLMSPQPAPVDDHRKGLRGSLLEIVGYIFSNPILLGLLVISAAQGLFLNSYITLLPVFASDILHVGPTGLGWLNAAIGLGALAGALGVANLGKGRRGQVLFAISLLMPIALAGFAWSTKLIFSIPLLLLLGIGMVVIRTITATIFLTIVPNRLLGRVSSLATLIYFGAPYIGGLPAGYLAENWGVPFVLCLAGILFFITMVIIRRKVPDIPRHE